MRVTRAARNGTAPRARPLSPPRQTVQFHRVRHLRASGRPNAAATVLRTNGGRTMHVEGAKVSRRNTERVQSEKSDKTKSPANFKNEEPSVPTAVHMHSHLRAGGADVLVRAARAPGAPRAASAAAGAAAVVRGGAVSEGCVGTCPARRRTRARPASNGIRPRVHVSCMRCRGPPTVALARALTSRPRARPSRDADRPRDSHAPTPGAPVDRARASPGREPPFGRIPVPRGTRRVLVVRKKRLLLAGGRAPPRRQSWTVLGGRWCPRT